MKKKKSNIILIFVFLIGLSLLLYPTVSDYWNSFHQTVAIADYDEKIKEMDHETYDNMWKEAEEYNKMLSGQKMNWILTEEEKKTYEDLLDISGTGIMGYIEIPAIDCEISIYHGTDESVLRVGVGHIEGTSLPIGGLSTHSVLSGHRGLPTAKLFSDLDEVAEGDYFMIHTLDQTLTYEVDKISIVLPRDVESLKIEEGKDYCTLVTCTPYGVNTHRLLLRGRRVENVENSRLHVSTEAVQIEPIIIAPILAVPAIIICLVVVMLPKKTKIYYGDDVYEED